MRKESESKEGKIGIRFLQADGMGNARLALASGRGAAHDAPATHRTAHTLCLSPDTTGTHRTAHTLCLSPDTTVTHRAHTAAGPTHGAPQDNAKRIQNQHHQKSFEYRQAMPSNTPPTMYSGRERRGVYRSPSKQLGAPVAWLEAESCCWSTARGLHKVGRAPPWGRARHEGGELLKGFLAARRCFDLLTQRRRREHGGEGVGRAKVFGKQAEGDHG